MKLPNVSLAVSGSDSEIFQRRDASFAGHIFGFGGGFGDSRCPMIFKEHSKVIPSKRFEKLYQTADVIL